MSERDVTIREAWLLGVIRYLDEQDPWYLDQDPAKVARLREDFGFVRDDEDAK